MRLNSALASSFLFVSIVLADYRPGEHQPRFPNSVNKNINDASVDQAPWAGAVLIDNEACLFRTEGYIGAIGSFSAPSASGDHGISIEVGIGGIGAQCNISFAAGINVLVTGNVVSYLGRARWGAQVTVPPETFHIAPGNVIQASVYLYSARTGSAILKNLSNGQSWGQFFFKGEDVVCQQSAEWVVTALAYYSPDVPPIPEFSEVTFVNATAQIAGGASVMPGPGGAKTINNIEYYNMPLTNTTVSGDTVTVAYTM